MNTEVKTVSKKPYQLAVVIGRFEPFHAGHGLLLNKALLVADKVVVLVGSANLPRTVKNPFSYEERRYMVKSFGEMNGFPEGSLYVVPIQDNLYSDTAWEKQVQGAVGVFGAKRVCIVGHKKDSSSYYLDRFPQWDFVNTDEFKLPGLDATNIRNLLFSMVGSITLLKSVVPPTTYAMLEQFVQTEDYQRLVREFAALQAYKASWAVAPYAPTFVTTDAVVTKAGHVLMVQRKDAPGEGLWALPGGFLKVDKEILDSALEELYEETHIDVPPALLKGSITKTEVFSHPNRSARGRTITHAYLFNLDGRDNKPGLPKVRADDDAADARWIPVNDLMKMSSQIFEDHLSIITRLLGL